MSVVKDGLAFGLGSSVARHLVDSVFKTPPPTVEPRPYPKCETMQQEFESCVQLRMPEETCQKQLDGLNACFKKEWMPSLRSDKTG
jgi:hypothetical protein